MTLSLGGVGGEGWPYEADVEQLPGYPDYAVIATADGLVRLGAAGSWVGTGRNWAVRVANGVLLPSADGRQLQLVTGSLDDAIFASDPMPADSAEMIAEANRVRAGAGLLPLIGDARIAQAARNHSRYWTLNDASGQGLGPHGETPGNPGFTGQKPSARCAAVDVYCGAEVMYEGVSSGADAVQGWIATAFHRSFLMGIAPTRVGGGMFPQGPAVMDAGNGYAAIGKPVGYPRGLYSGPLSFSGETPDPGDSCSAKTISAPYGTAISISLPAVSQGAGDGPAEITLRDADGSAVQGCLIAGRTVFQPDDALKPNTRYEVTATWNGQHPDLRWTFTTAKTSHDGRPSTAKKRLRLRLSKHGHRLTVDANPDSTAGPYRATLQRLKSHKRTWHRVRKLRLAPPKHRKTLRLKSGTYRVVVPKQSGFRGTSSRNVRIR